MLGDEEGSQLPDTAAQKIDTRTAPTGQNQNAKEHGL